MSHELHDLLYRLLTPASGDSAGHAPEPSIGVPVVRGNGAASVLDAIRTQALIFEEMRRIRNLLIDAMPRSAGEPSPGEAHEDEVLALLRHLQTILLKHPVAAQAIFSALVAEGRRFSMTPEGAEWAAVLATSPLVQQGRRLWEALSFNMLEADRSTQVPSIYLETLLRAVTSPHLEQLLQRLMGAPGDTNGPAQ